MVSSEFVSRLFPLLSLATEFKTLARRAKIFSTLTKRLHLATSKGLALRDKVCQTFELKPDKSSDPLRNFSNPVFDNWQPRKEKIYDRNADHWRSYWTSIRTTISSVVETFQWSIQARTLRTIYPSRFRGGARLPIRGNDNYVTNPNWRWQLAPWVQRSRKGVQKFQRILRTKE